jgi:hypothetical protein
MSEAMALWRRLEMPGHDACRLMRSNRGWIIDGHNVSRGPAAIAYSVECDERWRSQRGHVSGWSAGGAVDVTIERSHDVWLFNGAPVHGLDDCVDLDFGFTPATNLFQLRRMALHIGEAADVPVAWFDLGETALCRVEQRYERRGENTYWYESPSFGYAAELEIAANGFVRRYPELWELEE